MEDSKKGASVLCGGLDEVGRGPLAGPMTTVVIAFHKDHPPIEGVTDSKKLSEEKREALAPVILKQCAFFGEGWATNSLIDQVGIEKAWHIIAGVALRKAPAGMELIVDGRELVNDYAGNQRAEPKADANYWQVGAASIVAKVLRDRYMAEISEKYPDYLWAKNKGYGTSEHRKKIILLGPSPFHRMSFLKKLLKGGFDKLDRKEQNKLRKEANKMTRKWGG